MNASGRGGDAAIGEVLGFHWGAQKPPTYRTSAGPISGPFKHRVAPARIEVFGPEDGDGVVGSAALVRLDGAGVAIWRVTVYGAELAGEWIVVAGRFRPAW
jgi:hypothetical protein